MRIPTRIAAAAAALVLSLPIAAQAHRAWLLPSATVLSGKDVWVTVDAAVSNDLFFFERHRCGSTACRSAPPTAPPPRPRTRRPAATAAPST